MNVKPPHGTIHKEKCRMHIIIKEHPFYTIIKWRMNILLNFSSRKVNTSYSIWFCRTEMNLLSNMIDFFDECWFPTVHFDNTHWLNDFRHDFNSFICYLNYFCSRRRWNIFRFIQLNLDEYRIRTNKWLNIGWIR